MNSNTQTFIPPNTMGYLKFAYFILQSNISLHDFFLDKSIQQIVHIVNDVVNNGNQHYDILCLLQKQHPQQHPVEPLINPHPINPDNIVNQLVSLARNTPVQQKDPNLKKIRPKPIPKVSPKDDTLNPETNPDTLNPDAHTPNTKVKKIRAKPKANPIVETDSETPNPIVENVKTPKVKNTTAKPKANPIVETAPIVETDALTTNPKVKKTRVPKAKSTPPIAETVIAETVIAETVIAETVIAETVIAGTVIAETVIAETVIAEVKKAKAKAKAVPKVKTIAEAVTDTPTVTDTPVETPKTEVKKTRVPMVKVPITNE